MENPVLWLVIPVLNEADNLRWLLPQMTQISLPHEIVVVDNGCSDDSAEIALAHEALVVSCARRGYGAAVQAGMRKAIARAKARGVYDNSILVVFDADGSSPLDQVEPAVRPIAKGDADLVIAQRMRIEPGAMPIHARLGNWLQVVLIKLATGFKFTDMGPLRCLSFQQYEQLQMEDPTWGWNIEMQMKAALMGLRIRQHGITYKSRRHGQSKISGSVLGSMRAGSRILASAWIYYWKAKRLVQVSGGVA